VTELQEAPLRLSEACRDLMLPRKKIDTFEWIKENIIMPDKRPFDEHSYPWTRGICEAWDDEDVKTVSLQFAARVGKTAIAMSCMVASVATDPSPALFGTSTQELAKQTSTKKLRPMLRLTKATRDWMPPDHRLLQTRLDLDLFTFYVGWSGSATTFADIDPRFLHGNEVDKWDRSTGLEADPLPLFLERGSERPDRKVILEGTPTVHAQSRIQRLLINGWDCRYRVPCPYCGRHQDLRLGTLDPKDGGLYYDRPSGETHGDPSVAYNTARYICKKCHKDIPDELRRSMVQKGVWCPKGQRVSVKGRVLGKRTNDVPDASFQLSRLYAPTYTFGDVAKQWATTKGDIEAERNFLNSWMGVVWVPRKNRETWDTVAERLTAPHWDMGSCPKESIFLCGGVDVQVDHYVYAMCAFGFGAIGRAVDWGVVDDWQELRAVLDRKYPHQEWGHLHPVMTLIDARYDTSGVLDVCGALNQSARWVYPYQGLNANAMMGKHWRATDISNDENKRTQRWRSDKIQMIKGNTQLYQTWMYNCLWMRERGEVNNLLFPHDAVSDRDLFEQLINVDRDEKGNWVQNDETIPEDLRDAFRLARCGADVYLRDAWNRLAVRRSPDTVKEVVPGKPVRGAPVQVDSPNPPERSRWIRPMTRRR
jgi:phage terminase large subunit GpA-like protein